MKKNVLLTCFGGSLFYEFFKDFQQKEDIELYIADMNPKSKARFLTKKFIDVLPADDSHFCEQLLKQAKKHDIQMIIPGSDKEVSALMKHKNGFADEGILVAVQDERLLSVFQSKTAMYDYLKSKGFPVPVYYRIRTRQELDKALKEFKYPKKPVLIKPNSSRGGRDIVILSEQPIPNKDNLTVINKSLFYIKLDGQIEFLLMPYIDGSIYDIDVLKYKNGDKFFGIRKRLNNVTKLFSGNIFEYNEKILTFSKKLYDYLPTDYLVDYDLIVTSDNDISLLEINPRPSGSTISYLPFGYNLYYILAKSYLDDEHIRLDDSFYGHQSVTFYKMVKGG